MPHPALPVSARIAAAAIALLAAGGAGGQTAVQVDPAQVATTHFLGFGANWSTLDYGTFGVTDQDLALFASRIRWMGMPVTRVMMLTNWALVADGVFDFDTAPMRQLYRVLDLCQREGVTVVLTDWGCEVDWVRSPGIADTADPKYAQAIGGYLDHLVRTKGYSVIRYFILVNEPNLEVGDFDRWKAGVLNVRAELDRRGLPVQILGSDESEGDSWHTRAVNELAGVLGGYDVHRYIADSQLSQGWAESYFSARWQEAFTADPQAGSKPMVVGEAGMSDGSNPPGTNSYIPEYIYGLWMADYGIQAARAGSTAVLAWWLDDTGIDGFLWGLWANRRDSYVLRPWFYPWALLSRTVPPGSTVYRVENPSSEVRVLAARSPADAWTFSVVNRGASAVDLLLTAQDARPLRFERYLYSAGSAPVDADGLPVPSGESVSSPSDGVLLSVPGESVVVATSVGPGADAGLIDAGTADAGGGDDAGLGDDAGRDAGSSDDAGAPDAGPQDSGADSGPAAQPDGGAADAASQTPAESVTGAAGCGCGAGGPGGLPALLLVSIALGRRHRM